MLDRQNEELSKVEQKLKQLAKQNGLSSIRYTIVMLLMELNEIKRNKTMLNEISLLHWQESPKELQRQIASESVEHKKSDIFNIKRVKHEKSMDITSDMIVKTMKQTDENPYSFSDDKRDQLIQLIKSLSDEKICFEQDSALEFLINYFHRQTSESIQSIIEILKSLMAMFILLDSTSLAEICKDLLQFCEKHAHDQTDRFHLPAPKLEQFRTKTLENAITQRSAHLQTLNPYDKTNLMLITSDDQDIQAYKLIHIYPHFVRLYKRHETLTRILRDQSNYNKSMGIQLSYLRLSDCIALLFPELPMLFMGSLQLYAISDAVVHQYDQDLQQCKAQKANIEKELTKLASDHNRREQLETVKTDADNAYIRSEQDYHSNLNKEALKQIRQLMEINRQLQVKCNHLATQIIEKIENKQQTKNDLQETQRLITSIQVSYNLNVLVNNTQYLMTKILENMTDKLELETLNNIEPFLTNLKVSIHLSCSSSLDTMHTEFLEYIYKDQLDLLLDHGLMVIECLYNERKKLVEPLSHIQSVLENFVDHFALFLIQLSQQYQQKQVDSLQNQYNSTMKARLNFDDIHLLEALSKTNLIRHFHHIENIDKNLDWYNHLTQFLVQGSSQASCILRSFAAPTTTNPNSNSKRLRYSFVFKLLNDEGQQILVFLQQTIGQLRAKYPEIEMLNDEPVIVYLIHLTKLLRYELLQMSTMNLKALKCNLNNIDRLTPRPNAQEIKSISDEWNKEINLLLAHRKKINEELINQKIENYHDRVRTIEEENKHLKIDYDLKCKQAHGRIEYIKKLSIDIVNNVKLIGQLLHEAKYRSNNFDIENSDTLLNDTVQIVRELLRVQQLIPKQCRLDDDKEGKYLKNMTCLDSIRIEVKSVKYHDTLIYTNWSYIRLTEWDSRIQLISEGHDKERVEGFSKPLDYDLTSTSVSDLFQYSIPSPSDSSSTSSSTPWILILFAGTTQNNKWAEMTRIPLDFLNFSSFIEQDITCRFGYDSLSTINLHLTPIITIKVFETSIEDGRKTIIQSENTAEQKLTAKSEDSFIKLKTEYQHLRPSDRKIKLVNWLMDLKNKCREIENISPQECTIPSEPNYKVICPQEISNDVPEIQMQIDKQALNVSSAPTHHFLMTQLTSEYEQLNRTILETINILNNNLDDNQLNRIQNGIVRRFDSADTLKKEMKIFQETFRFEKLATTLAKLHDTSIDVQKVLRSTSHFQQTLPRPIEHGSPVEFEEQLDKCRIIINETITLIHERNKQMSSVIQQQSRIINPHNIKKVVNVNSFLQSTYSPSTSKIIITKQNGEYFASLSSIVIRMEQIIQNWSYRQLRMKAIEIVNNSDDEIDFEFLSSSTERSLSVFIIDNSSNVVALHDSNSIKITPNVQANEGEYQEKWELKLANNRLSIPMKICCKIEPFSIVIDLPVMATTTDDRQSNQIKTYFVDFGVALAYQAHQQCKFTIKNPMSLDLCVKLRRKNGATGIFQIDNKHSNFLLFADESKEIAIDWIVQDIVQDSKCIYDIYFSKDFKYQILCLGKIRKISYDLLYKSHRLTGKQFREELQPCLPGTILYEELIIKNTGEVKMTMESKVENSSTAVVTILSHEQALLETNTSVTLKIDLQVNNAHRSIENLINLYFPHATQQPHFKLILNTTASWPELDRDLLNRFKEVEVEEKADEKQGQIVLLNKSPVEMLIDDLHSSSSHVIVDTLTSFPCTILPRQKTEFNFIYKVQTKLATFDCEFILKTNCEQQIQEIPFSCK
ncbi:unnamed protein product [Didymodactylos carnosus]|uniref:Uncharacterized protein n=1 Tax=Didymodactylos carnosus TaxID=1234261 RepID=A0A8S2I183_9BILA|nr:unnamed protein product [Didymodactylos carnosus]